MENRTITALPGLVAGHATDAENRTGCTAVLCPEGWTPGVFTPGFAPGSRETDMLRPESVADQVHGILLAGGSAFGLAAADGVMRFLRERGHGFPMPHGAIPLVSGAVVYDLDMNRRPGLLPDAGMGYAAAENAGSAPLAQGSVGAGTGARCGKLYLLAGDDRSAKSGIGSALVERRGILAGALAVVNALGNVHDPETGEFLAGGRDKHGRPLPREAMLSALAGDGVPKGNTVLAVVAVNVPLDKTQATRLARMAAAGLARAIVPAHLLYDGDIVFALAARRPLPQGAGRWTESLLGSMGAEALAKACANAVRHAAPLGKQNIL